MSIRHERVYASSAILIVLLSIGTVSSTSAQATRFDVRGVITDSTDTGLAGATVVVLETSDSTFVSFGVTRGDGSFNLKRVSKGEYILQVTFVGYQSFSESLSVVDRDVDFGRIPLGESVEELGELVVSERHIPMVLKGDTLEYNASAFPVRPNANVEELLKRLPGVEVERDGEIKAQGETVEKVLVDGKEFFGNDPKIATQNLPADAVDRVQVYDKQSDMAEFTGLDDGEESKTINLDLKEDRKNGYFGNVTGGYGGDNRYDGKANINRFSASSQLSFIGNLNNINRQSFSIGDYISFSGGMQALAGGGAGFSLSGINLGGGVSDGFSTTSSGGLNFNHDFGPKTSLRSSYFINYIDNLQERTVRQQRLLGASLSSLVLQNGDQNNRNLNHRLNLNLTHKFSDGQDVRLRTNLRASDATLNNITTRETLSAINQIENASNTTYGSDGIDFGADASLTYRKRLSSSGRSLIGELQTSLNDSDQDADLVSRNSYYAEGNLLSTEEISQIQSVLGNTLTLSQRVSYLEPLGTRGMIELRAERSQVAEDRDKEVFDISSGTRILDPALSSALDRTYTYNKAGGSFRRTRDAYSFGIGANVQGSSLDGDILDEDVTIEKNFTHVLPFATFSYEIGTGKNLDLQYRASTREPSMRDLQPFVDNSDPLNVYTGNPELSPEYSHSANLHFMLFDQFTFTNLFVFARAIYTSNKIVRSRTIDEQFRQEVTTINADGDWLVTGDVSFGTPIRRLGSKIRLSNDAMFNHGIEFINGTQNATNILRNSVDLRLENRDKSAIDVSGGARYTYNVNRYSLNSDLNQTYVNRTFYADVTYNLRDHWRLSSSFDYRLYSEQVFGSGQNIPLWSADISRTLLSDKVELQLVALDLLNENVGVNYTNTGSYIQEEQINSLGRYVMFKVIYNLSGFGHRNALDVEMIGHE